MSEGIICYEVIDQFGRHRDFTTSPSQAEWAGAANSQFSVTIQSVWWDND